MECRGTGLQKVAREPVFRGNRNNKRCSVNILARCAKNSRKMSEAKLPAPQKKKKKKKKKVLRANKLTNDSRHRVLIKVPPLALAFEQSEKN